MEAPVKRERNDSTGGSGEPSSKRQRVDLTELEVEDDIYIFKYSGELRKTQHYVRIEEKIEESIGMNLDDFREALDNSTGKAVEMKTLLNFVLSCVLSAEQRVQLKDKLDVTFSRAEFADVAPFFPGLNPRAPDDETAGFGTCSIHPMRVPDIVFKQILHQMDSKFNQYGWPWQQDNETARNHCIAEILTPLLDIFKGVFTDKAEVLMESEISKKKGRVEHRWLAFGSICAEYEELKSEQRVGKKKLKAIAQMMLEADACTFENDREGFCIPIIGMLVSDATVEALVYHPHSRRFHLSEPVNTGFTTKTDINGLIRNIRRMADHMFGLLVPAYINALDAFLEKSEQLAKKEKATRESTAHWQEASLLAKKALKLGREAVSTIRYDAGNRDQEGRKEQIAQAKKMSEEALQLLLNSVAKSPSRFERPSLHEFYIKNEETMHNAEALDTYMM